MRVVLLRPPRHVWPFNSETSAFWQPLGLLCLAAAARGELPDLRVEVWDAPGEKMGWQTLRQRVEAEPIDVLGVGEETVSAHEALRAARLVKRLHPECLVVAGGTYFAHTIEQTLSDGVVDVIVRGEGERTFVEWLRRARRADRWAEVKGIAFRNGDGKVVVTSARGLIADLDALPFAAYDLIDMGRYGRGSRNHPALVSIEHSRGCVDSCAFCILWKHMGEPVNGSGHVRPCWRTKSPERSFEEVVRLYRDFGRRTFGWVDPTFNASAGWADRWADLMLRSELVDSRGRAKTLHTAWLRADCVVRDEGLGILDKLVRSGLRQVMIGVERPDQAGLSTLGKHDNAPETCRQAFEIFRRNYPHVYTIGTVIFGLPGDTPADVRRLIACQYEMPMDYCFMIPLTPNPGTAVRGRALAGGYVANDDPASYNFHTPVCRTDTMSLRELEGAYYRIMLSPDRRRIVRALRHLLTERDPRKRRVHRALLARGARIAAKSLLRAAVHPKDPRPTLHSRKPSWYDS